MPNQNMLREILGWAFSGGLVWWLADGGMGLKLLLALSIATGISLSFKAADLAQRLALADAERERLAARIAALENGATARPETPA